MNADACLVERTRIDPRSLGALLVNSAVVALAVIRGGRIVFANPAFRAAFHATAGLSGVPAADIVFDADGDGLAEALDGAEHLPTRWFGIGRRADDLPFDLELCLEPANLDGEATVIAFAWDVTEEHRSREHLACLAYSDPLTGLANRALFADRLYLRASPRHAVRRADGGSGRFQAGQRHIRARGGRHRTAARRSALSGLHPRRRYAGTDRIGGDEFAVLLPHLPDRRMATQVAERLIAAMATPLDFSAPPVAIGATVGIAVWPEHAGSVDGLLAAADTAMYRAKRAGKNRLQWAAGSAAVEVLTLPPLAWSAAHEVGIKEIDDQHLHLARLIDRLSADLKDGRDGSVASAGLGELIRYAAHHFATEERLMATYQLDDRKRHHEEHQRLLHDIGALHVDGAVASISLILRYLHAWLLRHVDGLDRQLGQRLIALGCH